MAITEEGSSPFYMPVAPAYQGGAGGFGNGFGGFGGDGWWIILLFLLLIGNNGWGNNGANGGGLYPWMNQAEVTTGGFRDQMLNTGISGVRDSIGNLSTQLCNCCCDMRQEVAGGFAAAEQAANTRQIANLQQAFAAQTAVTGGLTDLSAQLASCCCENRLGTADLKYTVAQENCADRAALSDGIRDIIASNSANTQRILDQLCQDKIDEKNDTISQLRQELLYARGQASQDVQTAALRAGQATTANQLVAELRSCPIPAMPVYGMTPIFSCNGNNCGCNCGCGVG